MKRIIGTILISLIVLSCIPFTAFAANSEMLKGVAVFDGNDSDTLTIDNLIFKSTTDYEFKAVINVSDSGNTFNQIQLNGKNIANLVDGENVVTINTADLIDGDNELRIVLGTDKALYNENTVYGTVNIDDIVVESVSFEGVGYTDPKSVNYYLPIVNAAGVTKKSVEYKDGIAVGDGWYSDTKLGGSTPNTPVFVGYVFEYSKNEGIYIVDTNKLKDGEHKAVFKKNGNVVSEKSFTIDNSAPVVKFSVKDGALVSKLQKISFETSDITNVKTELYVDGKRAVSINPKKLSYGKHVAVVTATDRLGNKSVNVLRFEVTDKLYYVEFFKDKLNISVLGSGKIYSGQLLKDLRMFENRYGAPNQDFLRCDDEVLISFDDKSEHITESIGDSVPYQSFVVNVDGVEDKEVLVSYSGTTGNGSDIVLKAWNYKMSAWEKIATVKSGESVSVYVPLDKFSYKKKMRINAMPDVVFNGSDTLLWSTDTQHYSRFEDLNDVYYKINEYAVEQYQKGNIGYLVHTGDLVDQTNAGDAIANSEFAVASKAQEILDKALVPNGVVSGNHDVVHTGENYEYYWKYFGEDRYKDFDWYGGSLNNNMHHFDLISLGSYDFVFLYIGNHRETDEDLIEWANNVCKAYPERNVVICTHEYLLPSGEYSGDRAQVIWDKIVVPNENVKMILCGHNEGVCDQIKQVGDSNRYVLEILADYQFAELGVGPQHVMNGCTCDGEGFVRLMTFNDAGQVISKTYSPVASDYDKDPNNYYPSYLDSFVYEVDLIKADRSICTKSFNVMHNPEFIGNVGEEDLSLKGCEAFYAEIEYKDVKSLSEIYVLWKYEVDYDPDKVPKYPKSEAERIEITGYDFVSENFRMNEDNKLPDSEYIDIGLNLLPTDINLLKCISDVKEYDASLNKDGSVSVFNKISGSGVTWVSMGYTIIHKDSENNNLKYEVNSSKQIILDLDKYNRLYFGVSSPKNAKWNIQVNFLGGTSLNFSQNEAIASKFGYVNSKPSDIRGTWNGYIDLSEFLNGKKTIHSIYITNASSGEVIDFDYLFIGRSDAGKVRFITDENKVVAYENTIGQKVALPGNPFKNGYEFVGWYTAKEGGEKVTDSVVVSKDVTEIYARFEEKQYSQREVNTSNTEINLERPAYGKIIFVCASLAIMVIVVIVLLIKISRTKKKKSGVK